MRLFTLTLLVTILLTSHAHSQAEISQPEEKRAAATFGILQGGGALIGVDLEVLATNRFGIQAGAGLMAFGAGLNYHLKPGIRSSFISLQYWNQGMGDRFVQSAVGPSFVYRGKKWFTCQLGLGKTLKKGPQFPADKEFPPVMLLYSIGAYVPF